jgi:hypothetical protein
LNIISEDSKSLRGSETKLNERIHASSTKLAITKNESETFRGYGIKAWVLMFGILGMTLLS